MDLDRFFDLALREQQLLGGRLLDDLTRFVVQMNTEPSEIFQSTTKAQLFALKFALLAQKNNITNWRLIGDVFRTIDGLSEITRKSLDLSMNKQITDEEKFDKIINSLTMKIPDDLRESEFFNKNDLSVKNKLLLEIIDAYLELENISDPKEKAKKQKMLEKNAKVAGINAKLFNKNPAKTIQNLWAQLPVIVKNDERIQYLKDEVEKSHLLESVRKTIQAFTQSDASAESRLMRNLCEADCKFRKALTDINNKKYEYTSIEDLRLDIAKAVTTAAGFSNFNSLKVAVQPVVMKEFLKRITNDKNIARATEIPTIAAKLHTSLETNDDDDSNNNDSLPPYEVRDVLEVLGEDEREKELSPNEETKSDDLSIHYDDSPPPDYYEDVLVEVGLEEEEHLTPVAETPEQKRDYLLSALQTFINLPPHNLGNSIIQSTMNPTEAEFRRGITSILKEAELLNHGKYSVLATLQQDVSKLIANAVEKSGSAPCRSLHDLTSIITDDQGILKSATNRELQGRLEGTTYFSTQATATPNSQATLRSSMRKN